MYYFKKFSETMPNKNKFYHCTKIIFSFSQCFEKVVFPKKTALEYDLYCIIRKDHISFSRKFGFIL